VLISGRYKLLVAERGDTGQYYYEMENGWRTQAAVYIAAVCRGRKPLSSPLLPLPLYFILPFLFTVSHYTYLLPLMGSLMGSLIPPPLLPSAAHAIHSSLFRQQSRYPIVLALCSTVTGFCCLLLYAETAAVYTATTPNGTWIQPGQNGTAPQTCGKVVGGPCNPNGNCQFGHQQWLQTVFRPCLFDLVSGNDHGACHDACQFSFDIRAIH